MKFSAASAAAFRKASLPSIPWYFRKVPSYRKILDFKARAVHLVTR